MNKEVEKIEKDFGTLAIDARELMAATVDVAGEKVAEARRRLASALEKTQETLGRVRDKTVAGAKVADQTIRENPYKSIAIAFGVGAIVGYLISRRNRKD